MSDLFSYGHRNLREFFRANLVAVLWTIIFHLVVLIVLVVAKTEGLKKDRELGVMLDFTEERTLEEMLQEEEIEVAPEWIEQVVRAREEASNRAVNLDDRVNREISTDDYVNELLNELEAQKDEEFLKNREQWKEIISSYVYDEESAPQVPEKEEEQEPFTGPTTITYAFSEAPQDRKKHMLTIPVYRCEGSAMVEVDIEVARDGTVSGATVVKVESVSDPACFVEAAENAALTSVFHSDFSAPARHRARITYQFMAQ